MNQMKSMGIALSFFIETIVIFVCVCVINSKKGRKRKQREQNPTVTYLGHYQPALEAPFFCPTLCTLPWFSKALSNFNSKLLSDLLSFLFKNPLSMSLDCQFLFLD